MRSIGVWYDRQTWKCDCGDFLPSKVLYCKGSIDIAEGDFRHPNEPTARPSELDRPEEYEEWFMASLNKCVVLSYFNDLKSPDSCTKIEVINALKNSISAREELMKIQSSTKEKLRDIESIIDEISQTELIL